MNSLVYKGNSKNGTVFSLASRADKFDYFYFFSKCHKYSPSEPTKAYDKTVSRKVGVVFSPEQVLRYVEEPEAVRSHEQLVRDYLEVRV